MGICYCSNPDRDKEDGNLHGDHTVELKKKQKKTIDSMIIFLYLTRYIELLAV